MPRVILNVGDVSDVLANEPDNSFDAVLCDPPYGLSKHPDMSEVLRHWLDGDDYEHRSTGFMGRSWDSFVPGPSAWREVLRVLKPGGFALVFAGTRTMDLMGLSLRLAGFEIRDVISYMYGSGFPKSLNIGKAIDKKQGNERKVVGRNPNYRKSNRKNGRGFDSALAGDFLDRMDITAPGSEDSSRFDGYGTALKPSYEPILVVMKPLEGTFADNAFAHGVAGLNIDGSRINYKSDTDKGSATPQGECTARSGNLAGKSQGGGKDRAAFERPEQKGRWPANTILCHHPDCEPTGETFTAKGRALNRHTDGANPWGNAAGKAYVVWNCRPDCPVRLLDEQSGITKSAKTKGKEQSAYEGESVTPFLRGVSNEDNQYEDTGGASRFFYTSKVAKKERNKGCDKLRWVQQKDKLYFVKPEHVELAKAESIRVLDGNPHPTLKPIDLCQYLSKLVLPPSSEEGRRMLVPFSGAGSEIIGALNAGWEDVVGIELDSSYTRIAAARIKCWSRVTPSINSETPISIWKPKKPKKVYRVTKPKKCVRVRVCVRG